MSALPVYSLLALAGQLSRTGRSIGVQFDRFSDLIAEAYEAAVRVEIRIHPLMALRECDAEVISNRRVDVELLGVLTERRLPDDRIRVTRLLEQSLADRARFGCRHRLEVALVAQQFRHPLNDLVVGICHG